MNGTTPVTTHEQDTLILETLPVVGYCVSELIRKVPAHVQREDLASAGYLALTQAARTYDPSRGVPFNRYASTRIRGAILDELRSMDWASRKARKRMRELASVTEQLAADLGRQPDIRELADVMGTAPEDVRAIRDDANRQMMSLDSGEPLTISAEGATPEERVLVDERLRYLTAGVGELPENLRIVVQGIFFEERSVVEIAAELGVTQSRISQLRTQALGMLRDAMNTALDPDQGPVVSEVPGVAEKRRLAYYAGVAERAAVIAAKEAHRTRSYRTNVA